MLKKINHIAIAVAKLEPAIAFYQETLGVSVCAPQEHPEHGVRVAFVPLENVTLELMEPLGHQSPLNAFLARNPKGGLHHLSFVVDNVEEKTQELKNKGVRTIPQNNVGAQGTPVTFLHPQSCHGVLIELQQESPSPKSRSAETITPTKRRI